MKEGRAGKETIFEALYSSKNGHDWEVPGMVLLNPTLLLSLWVHEVELCS